jgi:hypothetical protein
MKSGMQRSVAVMIPRVPKWFECKMSSRLYLGFRLLLLAEVSVSTLWSVAEKEAWVKDARWSGREPSVKFGNSSRLPSAMVVPDLCSHCGR